MSSKNTTIRDNAAHAILKNFHVPMGKEPQARGDAGSRYF
jgi:hypothetical protein